MTSAALADAASANVAVAGRDPPSSHLAGGNPPAGATTVTTPAGRPAWRVVTLAGAAVAGLLGVAVLATTFLKFRNHSLNRSRRDHT